MTIKKILLAIALACFAVACGTSITPAGRRVKYMTKAEPAASCQQIDSVSHDGAFECEPSVSDLQNALRNKTAQMAGDTLVVDVLVPVTTQNGTCFQGTGRAFRCAQTTAVR